MFVRRLGSVLILFSCLATTMVFGAEQVPAFSSDVNHQEKSCSKRCLDCLQRAGIVVGIKAVQFSVFIGRWATADTTLIPRHVIHGYFNHIKLCKDDEVAVAITTYDGFQVDLPQLFLDKIKKELNESRVFDLSHYRFATGNAVYALYAALSGLPLSKDKLENLPINYWSEIFLLAEHFGIEEKDIQILSFYQEVALNCLARKEADKMVASCCRPFLGSDLYADIEDRFWLAVARYADEKKQKKEYLDDDNDDNKEDVQDDDKKKTE